MDPVEPADVYPACDHNYITSPVGSPREVYDSSSGMFGHAQDYIHRCTKCGEYYYTTEYTCRGGKYLYKQIVLLDTII